MDPMHRKPKCILCADHFRTCFQFVPLLLEKEHGFFPELMGMKLLYLFFRWFLYPEKNLSGSYAYCSGFRLLL